MIRPISVFWVLGRGSKFIDPTNSVRSRWRPGSSFPIR